MRIQVDCSQAVYFPVIILLLALSSAVRLASGQGCTQITTCIPGQPMINCSTVARNSSLDPPIRINSYVLENIPPNSVVYCLDDNVFFDQPTAVTYDTILLPLAINDTMMAILLTVTPDREINDQLSGRIMATDTINISLRPTITAELVVNIIDVNEHSPKFSLPPNTTHSLRFTEGEPLPVSVVGLIGNIQATDEDDTDDTSTVNVRIEGIGNTEFTLIRRTLPVVGPIYNLQYRNDSFDREHIAFYQLTIVATDTVPPVRTSNPSLQVNITIDDINDNAPQFTDDRTFVIPEGLEEGVFVGNASASDPDVGENGTISYSIDHSSIVNVFTIERSTGVLRTSPIYESFMFTDSMRRVTVRVLAQDSGAAPQSSTAVFTVIIQAPLRFTSDEYMFELEENNNSSVSVGRVNATSPDPVSFYYRIVDSDKFAINNSTGEISARVSLDRETSSLEMFTVAAVYSNHTDLSSTATVRVTVTDVNDNDPQFGSLQYTFEVEVGRRIAGEVFANDSDIGNNAIITFSISTSTNLLSIEKTGDNTANIVVMEDEVDETAKIEIGIVAIDGGGRTGSSRVTVNFVPASSSDGSDMIIVVIASVAGSVVVVLLVLVLIVGCLCYRRYRRKKSGHFNVAKSQLSNNSNGFPVTDNGSIPRKRSILKVTTNKFGSSSPESQTERVKFESRANMVMFELDQPTSRKEASITTDTKLGSGDDSSICSGHGRHIDRDEGLILRKNPPTRTALSSSMTDSDDETDLNIQLFQTNNHRTPLQPAPLPIGVTNHAYSPPISHHFNKKQVPLSHGAQMLSSENLDKHNRAMAKHHRKVLSDQYSETSEGTGTYFTSDAEDGSAYGESVHWTNL